MSIVQFIFYGCSVLLIASALMVITSKNAVRSVMFLILTFFYAACIWMILEAEFLAILLILVYVGAVMVLFLFVVMMLDINIEEMRKGFVSYLPIGILIALILAAQMIWVVGPIGPDVLSDESLNQAVRQAADYSNTKELGRVLYTVYVLPFEIAAVILLVAIIAAITLTLRRRPNTRHQTPSEQVKVKREDRLRIVKMDAEEKE